MGPPLMSVIVSENENTKRIIDCNGNGKLEQINWKIIESADAQIGQFRADNSLLIDLPRRSKQIYIVCQLAHVQSIKEINAQIDKKIVNIKIKSGKYENCQIDLSKYEIVSSSMSASWYKRKKELKLTFDIAPMSRLEIEKMREKHRQKIKTMKTKKEKTEEIVNDDEKSFLIKEVSTKCIVKKEEKKREVVPLCHHKLRMKEVLITKKGKNEGKSFWICAKPQSEK